MKFMRSLVGATVTAAVLALASPAAAQKTTLRIESVVPAGHATSQAMEIFKTELERRSGGSIEVEVAAGVPRSLKELIDAVHAGQIFATWTSIGNFSRLVPEVAAVSLPFVFENYDEARRAVASPVGTLIETKLGTKGFAVLAWMELGALHVTNAKRPLKTLDDFKGLSLRVLPNETHLATFRAIGARPVGMDLKEVDAALRQGDIEGQEQDYSATYTNKYFESQKYLSDTGHFLDFHVLVADRRAFASLEPKQQKAIREAAAIAAVQQHKMAATAEAAALAGLKEKGMQFDALPPETRVALRKATAGVIDSVKNQVGADLVDKVLLARKRGAGRDGHR